MFSKKLKTEKIEMVKRIIRQNHYTDTEKSMRQCTEMGLVVNHAALKRFSEKLELIDRIKLNKKHEELQQIETAQSKAHMSRYEVTSGDVDKRLQSQHSGSFQQAYSPEPAHSVHVPAMPSERDLDQARLIGKPATRRAKPPIREMTYNEIKQREAEITFALGELKIKETELLQELISLTEWLDKKEMN